MRLDLPGAPHLTYCTNIHRGESWSEIRAGLEEFLPPIKAGISPQEPFGVGLRLSGQAADALAEPSALAEFQDFLARTGTYVFTINAFPYGPFHGTRVKEEVYQPDWTHPERLRFTDLAADILAQLLPGGLEGSVSTVPGTFGPLAEPPGVRERIAQQMVRHAAHLVELDRSRGCSIALAVEPEPACMLETIDGTVAYFEKYLFGSDARQLLSELTGPDSSGAEAALRRHLGVCYDTCHAAVEFEDPDATLDQLAAAGIRVTKLQITSALRVAAVDERTGSLLEPFDDGVYLHQTIERRDGRMAQYLDLPQALEAWRAGRAEGEWRVHCHVPVFVDRYGELASTHNFLERVLERCRRENVSAHLEAETYTWDVLPAELRGESKVQAIVRELAWARSQLHA